jgi:hypothetical protein
MRCCQMLYYSEHRLHDDNDWLLPFLYPLSSCGSAGQYIGNFKYTYHFSTINSKFAAVFWFWYIILLGDAKFHWVCNKMSEVGKAELEYPISYSFPPLMSHFIYFSVKWDKLSKLNIWRWHRILLLTYTSVHLKILSDFYERELHQFRTGHIEWGSNLCDLHFNRTWGMAFPGPSWCISQEAMHRTSDISTGKCFNLESCCHNKGSFSAHTVTWHIFPAISSRVIQHSPHITTFYRGSSWNFWWKNN